MENLKCFNNTFFQSGFTLYQAKHGMELKEKEEEKDGKDIGKLLRKGPKEKGVY